MAAGGSAHASQRRCVLALLGLIVVAAAGILGASVGYSYGAYSSSRWAPLRIESAAPDGMAMANVEAPAGQETAIVPLLLPQLADFAACADGNGNNFANGTTLPVPLRCPKASLGGRTVVDVGVRRGLNSLSLPSSCSCAHDAWRLTRARSRAICAAAFAAEERHRDARCLRAQRYNLCLRASAGVCHGHRRKAPEARRDI